MTARPQVTLGVSFLFLAWSIIGCGSLPNGRGWGQDATLTPGWGRIGQAAWNAAASPATWGPAAGALAFQVGSADRNLAQWAMDHTPLYGSQENAADASDIISNIISAAYVGTAFATPSGDDPGEWVLSKAKGFAVGYSAVAINSQLTGLLKDETARTRPNGQDTQSFPSNHASKAGVYATLADRNVDTMSVPKEMVIASRVLLVTLTAGVSWARVEAGAHYPSDVLAGVAMGHFIGAFINDAFLGIEKSSSLTPVIRPARGGVLIGFTIQY